MRVLPLSIALVMLPGTLLGQVLASTVAPNAEWCGNQKVYFKQLRESLAQPRSDSLRQKLLEEGASPDSIERALSRVKLSLREFTAAQEAVRDRLRDRNDPKAGFFDDSMIVAVIGDASVRSAVRDTGATSLLAGALGVVRSTCKLDFTAQLNVAAQNDSIDNGFGSSILAPSNGGVFKAGFVDLVARDLFNFGTLGRWGLHTYLSASSSRWSGFSDSLKLQPRVIGATIFGAGVDLAKQLLRNDFDGTFVSVSTDFGLAARWVTGDVASPRNRQFRINTLGQNTRSFYGLEAGFAIQVSQVRGALQYYYFGKDVDGVSHGQLVAGFAVQGNILSKRTTRDLLHH